MTGRVMFDLAFNAAIAFAVSAVLVLGVARLTRRQRAKWSVVLLALPFIKALVEVARGIPDSSFFWAFDKGLRQDLGSFQLGLGVGEGRVRFIGALAAHSGDRIYPTSAGELLARGAILHDLGWLVEGLGVVSAAVAATLVVRRLVAAARFELHRRGRRAQLHTYDKRRVGRRTVDVYIDDGCTTSPFAGGVWFPYVCIPQHLVATLPSRELDAIVAHELAHTRRLDVLWTTSIKLATDLLWFCPFVRSLSRRVMDAVERAADESAIATGTHPVVLASAIVRVATLAKRPPAGFVTTSGSASRERLKALLDTQVTLAPTTRTRLVAAAYALVVVLVANSVLFAVFLGNHG